MDVVNSTGVDVLLFKVCSFPILRVKVGVAMFCCWSDDVIRFVVTEKEIPNCIDSQRIMKARQVDCKEEILN